jgi:hypothetical protein
MDASLMVSALNLPPSLTHARAASANALKRKKEGKTSNTKVEFGFSGQYIEYRMKHRSYETFFFF